MKKENITTARLIEDANYYRQMIANIIFMISGILVFTVVASDADSEKNPILFIALIGVIFLFPFGFLMGLRPLIRTIIKVKKVKAGKYYIRVKKCIDKQVLHQESASRDTQIIFSADDGVWVGHKKSKEIAIGDECYTFYFEGHEDPFMIYGKAKNELDDSLRTLIHY